MYIPATLFAFIIVSSASSTVFARAQGHACIVLFARAPRPGKVKTRLIPVLGAEGACRLHENLLSRALQLLRACECCKTQLWLDEAGYSAGFDIYDGPLFLQQGKDLGERMSAAFKTVLQSHTSMLLIGSDCPGLTLQYLQAALIHLESGSDLVLGPASDGGYVLIGLKRHYPALFENVDWGTENVLAQTLAIAARLQLQVAQLQTMTDIDRPEDLHVLGIPFNTCRE